jgi:adenylate cyclase
MAYEVEGKWLVGEFDPSRAVERHVINQGYVAQDPNGTILRVRRSDDLYTLTVKLEAERPIEKDFFDELWALTEGRRVEKERHIVPIVGTILLGSTVELQAEVDVFGGRHSGLIMAEIEVPTITHLNELRSRPPNWFGTDVTENNQYSNSWLAENGIPDGHIPARLDY